MCRLNKQIVVVIYLFVVTLSQQSFAELSDGFLVVQNSRDKKIEVQMELIPWDSITFGEVFERGFGVKKYRYGPDPGQDEVWKKTLELEIEGKLNIFNIEIVSNRPLMKGYGGMNRRSFVKISLNGVPFFDSPLGGTHIMQFGDLFLNQIVIDKQLRLHLEGESYFFGNGSEKRQTSSEGIDILQLIKKGETESFLSLLPEDLEERRFFAAKLNREPPARYVRPPMPVEDFKFFKIPLDYESPYEVDAILKKYKMIHTMNNDLEERMGRVSWYVSFDKNPLEEAAWLLELAARGPGRIEALPIGQKACAHLFSGKLL